MIFRLFNVVSYYLSGFVPRDRRKVLFGAWMGHRFADNPKYFMLYLAEHFPALDLVWCGAESVRHLIPYRCGVRFVRYGSFAALKELVTCGSCLVTHGFSDVGRFNLLRGATFVYLGHGLAIKNMGSRDRSVANAPIANLRRLFRQAQSFSYYVATSGTHREKLLCEYEVNNVKPASILDIGQPRVDFLLNAVGGESGAQLRDRLVVENDLAPARRLITYMPTFRDRRHTVFSFTALEGVKRTVLETLLKRCDAVMLEKSHFVDAESESIANHESSNRIRRVREPGCVDTQELLLATDLLITDYSGCYLDYLVLDRPIVHFAYDRQDYVVKDRGLYFDLDLVAGGAVVESIEALCSCIEVHLRDADVGRDRRHRVRRMLLEYERGVSCDELARVIEHGSSTHDYLSRPDIGQLI